MFSSLPCKCEQDEKNKAEYFLMLPRRYLRPARDQVATKKNVRAAGTACDCEADDDLKLEDYRNESK